MHPNFQASLFQQIIDDHKVRYPFLSQFHYGTSPGLNCFDFFIHSRLFKEELFLSSFPQLDYTFYSSGTTGKRTQVTFNRFDALQQQRNILSIMKSYCPRSRTSAFFYPISEVSSNPASARTAAYKAYSMLAGKSFALPSDPVQFFTELTGILNSQSFSSYIIFGFTAEIFQLFHSIKHQDLSIPDIPCTLIHGGGWKKADQVLSQDELDKLIRSLLPKAQIINYYGMVEQLGSIFPSCEFGFLHTTQSNHIVFRDQNGSQIHEPNKTGLIQVISLIGQSLPNNSILTEDLGFFHSINNCSCGRPGVAFKVSRRLPRSEVRGCSNVYN